MACPADASVPDLGDNGPDEVVAGMRNPALEWMAWVKPRAASVLGKSAAARAVVERVGGWVYPVLTRPVIREYLASHQVRKLHIGAGPRLKPGWLNTDLSALGGLAYLDATARFPFEDGSFHYVFSEHFIEHIGYDDGAFMLRECRRVLADGGKIRIATPDLEQYIRLYTERDSPEVRQYLEDKALRNGWPRVETQECFTLNQQMRSWGHQFLYDFETLRRSVAAAGFRDIRRVEIGESDDPNLRGVEERTEPMDRFETMVLEATRGKATRGKATRDKRPAATATRGK